MKKLSLLLDVKPGSICQLPGGRKFKLLRVTPMSAYVEYQEGGRKVMIDGVLKATVKEKTSIAASIMVEVVE